MNRSVGFFALLAMIAATAVAGTAGASSRVDSPVKGTFKNCTDPTFPPLESKTSAGKTVGFDIDLIGAIGALWKVKVRFVETSFVGLLPGLAAKRCTVVASGLFITPDRLKTFSAAAYMRSHRTLLVQAGNPKQIRRPDDLSGKDVAVQAGTKYEEYLKALNEQFKASGRPQFTLRSYPGDNDAVGQLLVGRADVVLTQDTSSAYQKKQNPGKLAVAYVFPAKDTFGIYYRKADTKLGAGLRSAINTLKQNGTLKRIAVKYEIPVANVR